MARELKVFLTLNKAWNRLQPPSLVISRFTFSSGLYVRPYALSTTLRATLPMEVL